MSSSSLGPAPSSVTRPPLAPGRPRVARAPHPGASPPGPGGSIDDVVYSDHPQGAGFGPLAPADVPSGAPLVARLGDRVAAGGGVGRFQRPGPFPGVGHAGAGPGRPAR